MKASPELVAYFLRGPVDGSERIDFAELNKKAAKLGWIIHPDCCNSTVAAWLDSLTADHNATFYREWDDVLSKDRFEIFIDQLRHYASTYGELEEGREPEGNGWVNDGGPKPRFEDLKVLEPITSQELGRKCFEVIKSGIALKDSTMKVMCDYFMETKIDGMDYGKEHFSDLLSQVKNKEAKVYLGERFGVYPDDGVELMRLLVYKYTGKTLLIKDRATIRAVKDMAEDLARKGLEAPLEQLPDRSVGRLSTVFLRFKPLILAMKTKMTANRVNRLRRMAAVSHRPSRPGFWDTIVSNSKAGIGEVKRRLPELDAWRKVRLMMVAKERMLRPEDGVYVVRNGRLFVREGYRPKCAQDWVGQLYYALEESVVDSLRDKACSVRFPEAYELVLPTSEKNFVGNFPYGTSFQLTRNNILGVYWRNEWGTRDYDLSMIDLHGRRIGWNSSWMLGNRKVPDVMYSGDMTNANPDAVELMYISGKAPDGILKLNKFNGDDDSRFRFFFANEEREAGKKMGYMVDPNNIKFDAMVPFEGQGEKTIGILADGRFFLMDLGSGWRRVSTSGRYVDAMLESMKRKTKCFIPLKDILLRAGFSIWEPPKEGEEADKPDKPDLDLAALEKDTLIQLLK